MSAGAAGTTVFCGIADAACGAGLACVDETAGSGAALAEGSSISGFFQEQADRLVARTRRNAPLRAGARRQLDSNICMAILGSWVILGKNAKTLYDKADRATLSNYLLFPIAPANI